MRGIGAWVGVVAFGAAAVRATENVKTIDMGNEISNVMDEPWGIIDSIVNSYLTGFLREPEGDAQTWTTMHILWSLMRSHWYDPTFVSTYVGYEDGTMIAAYNRRDPDEDGRMSLLPGWACPWNYTRLCGSDEPCSAGYKGDNVVECRKYFWVDPELGRPRNCSAVSGASLPWRRRATRRPRSPRTRRPPSTPPWRSATPSRPRRGARGSTRAARARRRSGT